MNLPWFMICYIFYHKTFPKRDVLIGRKLTVSLDFDNNFVQFVSKWQPHILMCVLPGDTSGMHYCWKCHHIFFNYRISVIYVEHIGAGSGWYSFCNLQRCCVAGGEKVPRTPLGWCCKTCHGSSTLVRQSGFVPGNFCTNFIEGHYFGSIQVLYKHIRRGAD